LQVRVLSTQPGSRLTAELPGARALAGDDGVKRAGTGVTMAEPVATSEDVIPLTDVMARWAYTEAVGAHSSTCYDGCAGIEALRAKRRAGVPFSELSTPERSVLFAAWYRVRSAFFGRYLGRVRGYRLAYWTRESLVSVRVPPGVDPQYTDHPRLAEFFSTEASDPRDPRNAHNEQGAGRATIRSRWAFTMATTSLVMACTGGRRSWLPVFPPASLSTCRSRY
jgi:hypothetical protein